MPRKPLTTNQFIEKAKIIHGDKYDYSLVEYKNNHTKVKIICSIHGIFEQNPNNHLNKKGCIKCRNDKFKKDINCFLKESKKIHNNKYDYSLISYVNSKTKIDIICPVHGIFKQTPDTHLNGSGCPKCVKNFKLNTQKIIDISKKINGDKYDYSLVNYINSIIPIKLICKKHGIFKQNPNNHIHKKHGCPKCSGNKKLTNNEFLNKIIKVHGDKYDYSKTIYKNIDKQVTITCKLHGDFNQIAYHHLNGSGCPICKESKGEIIISNFLKNNNITFYREKTFNDCKYIKKLKFDFYLPNYNMCIEYDGKQHFQPIDSFGGINEFKKIIKRDQIKNIFCKKNNLILNRIKYSENIEDKLKKVLKL